mgnify:CR=1 FL=1
MDDVKITIKDGRIVGEVTVTVTDEAVAAIRAQRAPMPGLDVLTPHNIDGGRSTARELAAAIAPGARGRWAEGGMRTDDDILDGVQRELDAMRAQTFVDALLLIAGDACENYTTGPGSCIRTHRTPDHEYSADRWCMPCIAWRALHGGDAIRYIDGRILGPGQVSFVPRAPGSGK